MPRHFDNFSTDDRGPFALFTGYGQPTYPAIGTFLFDQKQQIFCVALIVNGIPCPRTHLEHSQKSPYFFYWITP